jgi:uncharacterized repeat protein (TIGR01451 family)
MLGLLWMLLVLPQQVAIGEAEAPVADGLRIDVQGPDTTRAGRVITFTVTVTNGTGQTLPNVVVTDSWYLLTYNGNFQISGLPWLTYTFRPTATQPYIRWDLGALAPGASGSIVITTDVAATLQPSTTKGTIGSPVIMANTAAIATSAPGVPSVSNGVNPLVIGPVMYLEKTFAPAFQRPGRLVTFTLKLANRPVSERADSISSTNTIITEVIPAKMTLWSVLPVSGVTYDYLDSAKALTYYLANPIQPGQSVYVTFTARISPTLKNAGDVNTLRNNRAAFGFRSEEVTIPRPGDADVALTGNDVLEKSVQVGPPPPTAANPPRTFPDRILTYTIGVYNPFTETLSGMRLTDTLPQAFVGGPYFIYSDTLPVAPFSAPAVISIAGRTVAWNLPDIEAWGVYSFALRVRVPANFDTGIGGRTVDNSIYAIRLPEAAVIYDNLQPAEAKVTVVPQIVPIKSIAPGSVFSGYPETYTLWLTNTGNTTITNIVVTDTLPTSQWIYEEMIFGPAPVLTTAIPAQVVWRGITLPAYSGQRLQFRVTAIGVPPPSGGNYCNTVSASSPDTFIPTVNNLACMQFLNPFRINKTAIVPNGSVVLGGGFSYQITVFNVSLQDYAVSQIADNLPSNFHVFGGGVLYTLDYSPPAAFVAGGSLSTQFDVVAESVPPDVCNKLPANIDQTPGRVSFSLVEPPQTWYNAGSLAPVLVYPHVTLANSSELPGAAPGELVTYTIVLTNNTSNNYTNLIVTDTLPSVDASNAFQFARMAPGSVIPEPQVNGKVVTWPGLSLAPNGALRFTFVVTATQMPGDNLENDVAVVDLSDQKTCIPWLGTGTNAKPGVRVNVRLKKLEYTKTAAPYTVGPLGLVQYNVVINNRGPYAVYNVVVTDVLPTSVAEPYWQFNSNVTLPAGVTPLSSNPPAWLIAQINSNSNASFSFKARASIYPGNNYKNYMDGLASAWTFTQAVGYNGAPVTIVPGAALDKVVSPKTQVAGERVIYTITLYNQSGSALTGIRITDTLPAGFTFDSMVSPAAPQPDSTAPLVWGTRLPTSLNNATRLELAFYARISATLFSGTYYNRVVASAKDISIPATDDTAPVKVLGAPNVSASKVVVPSSMYRGGTAAYTITLTNEGEDPLTVLVTDTLPAGLTFVAPLGGTPLPDSWSPVVWSGLTLSSGESRQLGFVAYVAPDAPLGTMYNRVDVSSGAVRFAGTGDTAPIYITPQPEYDVEVTKVGNPPLVSLGERVTYILNYHNVSADGVSLSNVTLNDTFPAGGVTYIDGSGWTEVVPGQRTLNIGDLPANASGVVTMVLQIDPSYVGDYLQNTVTITGTPSINAVEINPVNDTASTVTFIGVPPQVTINKTAFPTLVFAGEPVMYVLTLTNQSSAPLTLRVTDTMPVGFVFSQTVAPTPLPQSASPLVWQNLSLPGGQSRTLTWYALVAADVAPGFYTNDVALDANGLTLPGATGLAPVETDVRRYYDLRISKSDGLTFAVPGSIVTYTLRYTNTTSNVTLTQVSLTDIFTPSDYLTFLGAGWTQTAPGNYTLLRPDLAPGAGDSVLVPILIGAGLPDAILSTANTAIVAAVPTVRATETNPGNNISTDIDIVHGADLTVLSMTYAPARLRQYGPITVTVVFKNQGLDPTSGPDNLGWFGTDLYIKPIGSPPPSDPSDHAYGKCPAPTGSCKYVKAFNGTGLAAGEIYTVTYSYILSQGGNQALYVQADPYWNVAGTNIYGTPQHGRVIEGDETNNIFGPIEIYAQPAVYLPLVRRN